MTERTCTVKDPCSIHSRTTPVGHARKAEEEQKASKTKKMIKAEVALFEERILAIEDDMKKLAAMYDDARTFGCAVVAKNEELLEQLKGTEAELLVAEAKRQMVKAELLATRNVITGELDKPTISETEEQVAPSSWTNIKGWFKP